MTDLKDTLEGIAFTVPGEPQGKGRPRFARQSGRTYTPAKTAAYENLVKLEYEKAAKGKRFPDGHALGMRVEMYYSIPKSVSKIMREHMMLGRIKPTKKPDCDNCLKAIADALNHIAYRDDALIVKAEVEKYYSDRPRVDVSIWLEGI